MQTIENCLSSKKLSILKKSIECDKLRQATDFYELMNKRRTVREFTKQDVPVEIIEKAVLTAGTAPNGANRQPWFFAVVRDPAIKKKIREAAEAEEYEFYNKRADDIFLEDLAKFKLSWSKPHLEDASTLIVIFSKTFTVEENEKKRCYYPLESVGIATGLLITALHKAGVATLTHTPNPMRFLNQILDRPKGERPFLILAAGYQAEGYQPPNIKRKKLDEISKIY